MLFITSMGSIIAVSLLWYIKPDPSFAVMALLLSAGVMICGELAFVFYHALLPAVAPPERLGRVSGLAWGMGISVLFSACCWRFLCSFSRTHLPLASIQKKLNLCGRPCRSPDYGF